MALTTFHDLMSPQTLAIATTVGALAGTHAAIWGMYKDSKHEGFGPARFARSIVVGALAALVIQLSTGLSLPTAAWLVTLWGLAYAAERGVVETWKTFVREEDQAKYFIPMQFSVRGVPVESRGARLVAGAAYVGAIALVLWAISRLDGPAAATPGRAALVGLAVGFVIALGGAWKDAPKEGFELLKFFRSPAMTVVYAVILARLTGSYFLAAAGSIGFERATAETWKTFRHPAKAPGKFAGKPVLYPEMLVRRRRFVPAYVAICVAVLLSGAIALREATATGRTVSRDEVAEVMP